MTAVSEGSRFATKRLLILSPFGECWIGQH